MPFPRFRNDLAVSEQPAAEGSLFVIKDPVRRQFYRLREAEYFIARLLDGLTPLEAVRRKTEERFQTTLTPEALNSFVKHLDGARLLESEEANDKPRAKQKRVDGSLLYMRFRLFDPDRLFNWLITRVRFFYTPQFMVMSAGLILMAVGIAFVRWEDVTSNLGNTYQLSNLPLLLLVVFIVIGAHEFAHGLTCKHFGGEVHELGFLLIYFQPAMYCNVSDAWMFPEKSKRLWVGFAGPYFELFLWALATLVWRLTDVEALVNQVAYIVMTSSGVKTLLNFNPLLKFDGYYLMSDWLEIPNMRRRSFAYVGDGIKKLFGFSTPKQDSLSPRARRFCLAYGLVAATVSFAVLGLAFVKFGDYFISQQQPLAVAVVAGLLGLKVRRRLTRLFRKGGGGDEEDFDEPDAEKAATESKPQPTAPTEKTMKATETVVPTPETKPVEAASPAKHNGEHHAKKPADAEVPKPRKPKRKVRSSIKWFAKLAFLGIGVWLILEHGAADLRISGPLVVLPIHNADVRAAVEGIIDEVCVEEGTLVHQGDLIARLSDRDARSDLKRVEAQIDENRAKLKLLLAGSRQEEIELAQTTIARAEEQLKFARSRLERDRILYEDKLVSLNDYEDSKRMVAGCDSDLAEAKKKLEILQAGNRPEEIEAMQSAIINLETQQHYLTEQLQLLRVMSPATGVVATPARQLVEMRHQLVKKGDLIAKVFELKTITAEIAVSERDISDVKVGQQVVLKVRAYPDETFFGRVTSIATSAQISASSSSSAAAAAQAQGGTSPTLTRSSVAPKSILITTEIDNPELLLKPEMTGQAKISCGERQLLDLVTRRIARTIKVEFWSWW